MKHNVKDKTIEISAKVFVDDLEAVLKKNYHTTFDLSTATSKPETNAIVAKYLQSKLQLTVNDKLQTIKVYKIIKGQNLRK